MQQISIIIKLCNIYYVIIQNKKHDKIMKFYVYTSIINF